MADALFIAYRALQNGETPVSCLFVNDFTGEILAFGCNNTNDSLNGTRHAELEAIDKIMKSKGLLEVPAHLYTEFFGNVTVYVTIEPCVMCALALKQIGIRKVYFGAANDRFGGNGTIIKVQGDSSYRSIGGIMRAEAIHLLRCFYIQENSSAPIPKVKKNKDISGKKFSPNLDFARYMSAECFKEEFGGYRFNKFYYTIDLEREFTPEINQGYTFSDLCQAEEIIKIPNLGSTGSEDEKLIRDELLELSEILPSVDSDGMLLLNGSCDNKKWEILNQS